MQAFQGTTSTPTIVPDSPTHNVPPVQNAEPMQIAESLPARPTSIYPPHYLPMEHFPFLTTTRDLYSWAEFQTGKFCGVTLSIAPFADVAQALRGMRELVAALCERITDRMQRRIILKCPSQIKQMALCLDVRVLCGAVRRTVDGDESDALRALHTWAREVGKLDIGEFEDLQREHHTVKEKLCGVFEIA